VLRRIGEWFFRGESDQWLSILRVGLGVQVLLNLFALRHDWSSFVGGIAHPLLRRDLSEALLSLESSFIPRLGWFVWAGKQAGIGEPLILQMCWYLLAALSALMLLGLFCRTSTAGVWFVHLCVVKSGGFLSYGVDALTTTGLFYLMLSPLPDRFSLDHLWCNKPTADPKRLGFWRRVLQLHLCLIYLFSGLTKALGGGWWNGTNLWRALIRPPFDLVRPALLVHFRYILPIASIAAVLLELGYPLFIWRPRLRQIWLIGVLLMHVAIGLAMGMYLFALVMIVLNLAAFGPNLLWHSRPAPT
jgi:hypothetical protein